MKVFAVAALCAALCFVCATGQADPNGPLITILCNGQECTGVLAVCVADILCVLGGAANGDPILTGFDGERFEFVGEAGKTYNLYSDAHHQVAFHLTAAQLWNHNGTYVQGLGFRFHDQEVRVEMLESGDITVETETTFHTVDENMAGEGEERMLFAGNRETMTVEMEPYKEHIGRAVRLATDTLEVAVWATAPGTVDEGGMVQPGYLNFNMSLLKAPAGDDAQGLIGETFDKAAQKTYKQMKEVGLFASVEEETAFHGPQEVHSFQGRGNETDYIVTDYFDTGFKWNLFGAKKTSSRGRSMMESRYAALPYPFTTMAALHR